MQKQNKAIMTVKRIALDAVLISIYVVLRLLNIPLGNAFRFTLAPFAVIMCALLFGSLDGLIVGFLGELLAQLLTYGPTPTTLLWCLGETARGAILGLCALLFLRKWLLGVKRPNGLQVAVLLFCCALTGVLAAMGQTLALYVDSNMFGYYRYEIVFGVLIWRVVVYVLLSGVFGYISMPIISALKKAKLV